MHGVLPQATVELEVDMGLTAVVQAAMVVVATVAEADTEIHLEANPPGGKHPPSVPSPELADPQARSLELLRR